MPLDKNLIAKRISQELKDGFLRLRADQGNFFGRVGDVFERMQKLGDEENKILYRMLVGEVSPISSKDIKLASIMDGLTDEQQIAKLNSLKEIFNLGMITEQEYKIRFAKWEQEYKELFR